MSARSGGVVLGRGVGVWGGWGGGGGRGASNARAHRPAHAHTTTPPPAPAPAPADVGVFQAFTVTVIAALLSPFACMSPDMFPANGSNGSSSSGGGGGSGGELVWLDTGLQCFKGAHLGYVAVSALLLAAALPLGLAQLGALPGATPDWTGKANMFTAAHGRGEMAAGLLKMFAAFWFTFATLTNECVHAGGGGGVLVLEGEPAAARLCPRPVDQKQTARSLAAQRTIPLVLHAHSPHPTAPYRYPTAGLCWSSVSCSWRWACTPSSSPCCRSTTSGQCSAVQCSAVGGAVGAAHVSVSPAEVARHPHPSTPTLACWRVPERPHTHAAGLPERCIQMPRPRAPPRPAPTLVQA